jgi:dsDNA-specific endonuclease/ATPase MutS2
MVNLNELWIGDRVVVTKDNQMGVFEGATNGKAKIKIENKVLTFLPEDLSMYVEAVHMPIITFENEKPLSAIPKSKLKKVRREIDLHIEKLNPSFTATLAETVLDHQLKACEEFIKEAIDNRLHRCTIIHGKGEGKLRELVHTMLSSFFEVKMKILTNKDGATEVWLAYL